VPDYSRNALDEFLKGQNTLKSLIEGYPADWERSDRELRLLLASGGVSAVVEAAKDSRAALDRIVQSGYNPQVLVVFFPVLIRSRMMTLALKNYSLAAQTKTTGRVRFNRWNAFLLQKLLFEGPGLARKSVNPWVHAMVWPLVTQKSFLMPLVNKKGIYCFFSRPLVLGLKALVSGRTCVEVGAGDGTLSRLLGQVGCQVVATDNHSWSSVIDYPPEVENLDAKGALQKYAPAVVVSCWPDPGNSWEKTILAQSSTQLYIVLGSSVPGATGDAELYSNPVGFSKTERTDLARGILPREMRNQVLLFTRLGV
jgi:hypothetical protein